VEILGQDLPVWVGVGFGAVQFGRVLSCEKSLMSEREREEKEGECMMNM
jgi:hypothetical protein